MSEPISSRPSGSIIRTAGSFREMIEQSPFGRGLQEAARQGSVVEDSAETRIDAIQSAPSLSVWADGNPHASALAEAVRNGEVYQIDASTPEEDIPLSPPRPVPGLRR